MEFKEVIELIDKVSQSGIRSFACEIDNVKLTMECEGERKVVKSPKVQQIKPVEGKLIKSPLVGTFYAAPAEDAKPFVNVGDEVKKGQVLAIVEAMKLMNEIESDFDGKIVEILVENGDNVEYGQPLFRIQ